MNKGLDLIQRQQIETVDGHPTGNVYIGLTFEELAELEKELKALEIVKGHILNRDMDTSGIYLVFQSGGHYEPYYTIEIREGIKQVLSIEEYELLKEALV